jgi:hypothetical protein
MRETGGATQARIHQEFVKVETKKVGKSSKEMALVVVGSRREQSDG